MASLLHELLSQLQRSGCRGVLTRVINIESGQASVSTKRVFNCESCTDNQELSFDCATCGRTESNSVRFRSGSGECLASVIEISKIENFADVIGLVVVLDSKVTDDLVKLTEQNSQKIWNFDSGIFGENSQLKFIRSLLSEPSGLKTIDDYYPDIECLNCELGLPPYAVYYLPEDGVCECGKELNLEVESVSYGDRAIFVGDANRDKSFEFTSSGTQVSDENFHCFLSADRRIALVLSDTLIKEFNLSVQEQTSNKEAIHFALGTTSDFVETSLLPLSKTALLLNVVLNDQDESQEVLDELTNHGFLGAFMNKRGELLQGSFFQWKNYADSKGEEILFEMSDLVSITNEDGDSIYESDLGPKTLKEKRKLEQEYFQRNATIWAEKFGYQL
jgi:hypothetical protein